jgi:restriction system protein
VLLVVTAALDGAVVHASGALVPRGPAADVAAALSGVSVLAVLGLPAAVRRGRLHLAGIREIDAMTGPEFEERLALLYRAMGYAVRHTGCRGDFGADLVVERGDVREVVQAKRYDGAVGIEAVQQAVGALTYYDAGVATVVTNSRCTPAARVLASASGVELVEREALVRLLAAHTEGHGAAAARVLVTQLVEGGRLCAFVTRMVVRLVWSVVWGIVRVAGRGVRGVWRSTAA